MAVALLTIAPLAMVHNVRFQGADNAARDLIGAINPGYRPWLSQVWVPPSAEVEGLLFTLQAVLGALLVGYFFGVCKARSDKEKEI